MTTLLAIKHGSATKAGALRSALKVGEVVVVDTDHALPLPLPLVQVEHLTPAAILEALRAAKVKPDACFTYVDPAMTVTASVAEALSLPGLHPEVAATLKNKYRMRERLTKAGVQCPRYRLVRSPEEAQRAVAELGGPAVLKPVSGAYSLGVHRIDEPQKAPEIFRIALAELHRSEFARFFLGQEPPLWLVEEYLDGPEVGVELLGHPRGAQVLAIHEKTVHEGGGHFREDRFVTAPWRLTEHEVERIAAEAVRVAQALDFVLGVGSLEMRVTSRGIYAIELQACPIGGIVSTMVQRALGVSLHELHARAHLPGAPQRVSIHATGRKCAMDVLYADRPGRFHVTGIAEARACEGVLALEVPAVHGLVVEPYAEYLGFICCEATSADAAVARLDAARQRLRIVVDEH